MNIKKARQLALLQNHDDSEMIMYIQEHQACEVSGVPIHGNYHPHRIQSAGAGGKYTHINMIRLTHALHQECHYIGNKAFCIKYKAKKIRENLISRKLWTEEDERKYNDA